MGAIPDLISSIHEFTRQQSFADAKEWLLNLISTGDLDK